MNNKEYMIAANDESEMTEWLELIHKCMEEDSSAPKYVLNEDYFERSLSKVHSL